MPKSIEGIGVKIKLSPHIIPPSNYLAPIPEMLLKGCIIRDVSTLMNGKKKVFKMAQKRSKSKYKYYDEEFISAANNSDFS